MSKSVMKFQIMLGILFDLLARRKSTARELASKYDVSTRSIYRYLDEMTVCGVPIDYSSGRGGGVYISDAYKLPKGLLTEEEYRKAIEAALAMNEQLNDETLSSAILKLSSQAKSERKNLTLSGNILVDSGAWGDTTRFSEKLSLIERAVEEKEILEIDYSSREGVRSHRKIYPHLLVYKQNIWYTYAFCEERKAFRLFKLGRMRSIVKTDKRFTPVPFAREDVPLTFWHGEEGAIDALFEISPSALPFAEEWLGIENITEKEGKYFAEVTLPDDESLMGKILSAGAGFRVISPLSLRQKIANEAQKIVQSTLQ